MGSKADEHPASYSLPSGLEKFILEKSFFGFLGFRFLDRTQNYDPQAHEELSYSHTPFFLPHRL